MMREMKAQFDNVAGVKIAWLGYTRVTMVVYHCGAKRNWASFLWRPNRNPPKQRNRQEV
jgi:hypothetical protein